MFSLVLYSLCSTSEGEGEGEGEGARENENEDEMTTYRLDFSLKISQSSGWISTPGSLRLL